MKHNPSKIKISLRPERHKMSKNVSLSYKKPFAWTTTGPQIPPHISLLPSNYYFMFRARPVSCLLKAATTEDFTLLKLLQLVDVRTIHLSVSELYYRFSASCNTDHQGLCV